MQDRQIRRYFIFLLFFSLLLLGSALLFSRRLTVSAKTMLLSHDEAIASSLLDQGIPEATIAKALTGKEAEITQEGTDLLHKIGIRQELETQFLPHLHAFYQKTKRSVFPAMLLLCLLLLGSSLLFLLQRDRLYRRAFFIIDNYIDGDYSSHLPQTGEGTIYQLFSSVDQLATMLQAQNETEYQTRIFLKNTISDISHQLRTPLAALSMYQEIMESEPDEPALIQKFTHKTGLALKRMENLIESMLKITRLDAGSISFEKRTCNLSALISRAVSELTLRAAEENKALLFEGSSEEIIICDPHWTAEAIGNIVKNALDHTASGAIVRILWDASAVTTRITIEDDGEGIPAEDIHHIFKRFYRGREFSDKPGIGLGLPLAKSIIEGQNGTVSVQSTLHEGTVFTLFLPTAP